MHHYNYILTVLCLFVSKYQVDIFERVFEIVLEFVTKKQVYNKNGHEIGLDSIKT